MKVILSSVIALAFAWNLNVFANEAEVEAIAPVTEEHAADHAAETSEATTTTTETKVAKKAKKAAKKPATKTSKKTTTTKEEHH